MTTPDPQAAGSPIRVLVCDDQSIIRAGYVTIIDAQPDLEVVGQAEDGRTGVELARRLRPDVMVTDIRMPLLDGIAATRLLAGPDVDDPVKVLVVTTFNLIRHETVKTYVSRILTKLGLRDRVQAVVFAYQNGLVSRY
ncbi:response regulator [Actinoallomurus sp. NBC_01490]|uniref:response regulator transcription factor n=1 Tax=Actinoallomurus sp. NBC_01490 TaxID=2903557 RepID=UPI002E351F6D|nr:response regulator [Actinoallomurus sp. NBC_01490]